MATAAKAEPVKITFLPPPMEGTLSLGVYDAAGKLVRVLHQEIEPGELTKGDDGLETQWDGKDDQGKPCPPGTYRARGVMVGDLGVEGVDFIGNDWVEDENSPRVRRIEYLAVNDAGVPVIGTLSHALKWPIYYGISLKPVTTSGEDADVQLVPNPQMPTPGIEDVHHPECITASTPWAFGIDYAVWLIEGKTVKQYSNENKLLRTLPVQAGDPPPVKLTAFRTEDKLYVLYENATLQRLRGYDFTGIKPGGAPKVLFEQDIHASATYEQIASELQFPAEKPFTPSPALTVALVPNPLAHNKPGTLEIKACLNRAGCFLATADGLPLSHISDTRFLRWAVMGRPGGSNAITVFDGDGAVVEQFQISNIANMMAFDAGIIQWSGEMATPAPSPSATPTPSTTPALTVTPTATPAAPAKQ